ncbi:MAG TPA: response regulator [Desulfobacterales bacterium]|nr:response regulator [Desulfobacterales bacterium]
MPTKILFVDDEPKLQLIIRQLFRHEIRSKEIEFFFALNGLEALEKLKAEPEADIVMTDLNMPRMNGLTLLNELQKLKASFNPVLTTIVVSAYGDMANIRKAMNAGAFDFLTKPINFEDVKITLAKAIEHVRQLKNALRQEQLAKAALHEANEALERRVEERTAELLEANKDLEEARKSLEYAQEIGHIGSWTLNIATNRTKWSREMFRLFGVDPKESFDNDFQVVTERFIHPDDREMLQKAHGKFLADGEKFSMEYRIVRPDGMERSVWAEGHTIFNKIGEAVKRIGIAQDITEKKLASEKLKAAKENAEAASRAKSEFLANMSHEIRTPMNAIIGMGDLIMGTALSAKQREYLSILRSSSKSLLALLNDILDFSKIEAGKLDLEISPFMLHDLLNEVTDNFRNMVFQKGIELIMDARPDVPCDLLGDSLRLRQILINLIGNAFKFTEEGNICLKITVVEQNEHETVLGFTVSDTGIGIPHDKAEKLFDAFAQADTSTSRKYGGTGLGLSISQRLVCMMGGDGITVKSEPDKGSVFSFTACFGIRDITDGTERIFPNEIQGMNILLVEDNELTSVVLSTMLESFALRSESVNTAEEAMNMLRAGDRQFDLMLIDWNLPGMDGLKASEEILKDEKCLRIVLMSAYGSEEVIGQSEKIGISGFLFKPFDHLSLFNTIMEAFGYASLPGPRKDVLLTEGEFRGVSVLLTEDNKANQIVACEVLSNAGFTVDIAENGRQAVEAVRQNEYAAVLMDVQMPVMDGLEAAREIRKFEAQRTEPGGHIPIIAMTAYAMKGDRERCLEAGMNDYVSKPIDRLELFRTLKKWLPENSKLKTQNSKLETRVDSSVSQSPASSFQFPTLPGIDIPDALRRTGITWDVFARLLRNVSEDQKMVLEKLNEAMKENNRKEIRQFAHTTAGVGGNISAHKLGDAAKILEIAADEQEMAVLSELFETVKKEFDIVATSVASLEQIEKDQKYGQGETEPPDVEGIYNLLKILGKYLESLDPLGSSKIIESILDQTLPGDIDQKIKNIDRFIKDFAFDEAGEAVAEIINGIEG